MRHNIYFIAVMLLMTGIFTSKSYAQTCSTCPSVFTVSDSVACNANQDVVQNISISPNYVTFRPLSVCKNSRMRYTIGVNQACYPIVNYSFVSVSGGTFISLVNNQFVIQWGNTASGNVVINFSIPGGPGLMPCNGTLSLNFSLLNNPVAAFTYSPQPVCFNNPTNINFNAAGSTGAANYFWNFGDGFTSLLANPSHAYTGPGTYIVTLIASAGGFLNGQPICPDCTDSVQHSIVIDNAQGPDIACIAAVCAGDLQQYCTGAAGCGTYTWSVTGGTILSGQNTACISVLWGSGNPQGTISLTVTGCAAAACTQGTTVSVPIIPASGIISGPVSVCENTSASYVLPSWPATTYSWSVSGGGFLAPFNTNTNQVTINWLNAGNYTISCNYFDSSLNCGGSASYTVSVRTKLLISSPASVCQSQSSVLTAATTANAPVPSNWTIAPSGATILSGNGTPGINVQWLNPGSYSVTATSVAAGNVCNAATYAITVFPSPVIGMITGADSLCANGINVYSVASTASGPFTWNITNGTAVLLGANNDSVQVSWSSSGPYSLSVSQVSFPNNCAGNTVVKNVFAYPVPVITGAVTVCADNTQSYTITNIGSGNFQWFITPPSFGTIISGQGTASVLIKWHGNNNPGFSNTVYLHYGVCNADSTAITINEPSSAVITASGSLCLGGGVTLSTGATGIFSWTCTEHPIIPTPGNTPAITLNQAGHYHVQIQNYNGTGCTVTADYFIPDSGTPMAAISANGPLNYCLPALPNLTLAANNAPGYTFQWFSGNVLVGTGPTYTVNTLSLPGTYYYYAIVSLGSCTDTSNVIAVTISNCPPVPPGPCSNAAITVTSITGCNPFTLSVAAIAPAGAVINTPANPAIFHAEDASSLNAYTTHTYTSVGFKQVSICVDVLMPDHSVCRVCKDTVVTVTAAADFTGNIGCGSIALFDASTTVAPAVINSYTWQVGYNPGNTAVPPFAASFNNANIANPVLNVLQSGSYIITQLIHVGSCTITHSDTFNIHVPGADFNVVNTCVGTTVNFNNLFPEPVNFWNFGDAATSYTSPTFHAYAAAGTLPVTHVVTDINGCKDTVVKPITIIPAPTCNISYSGPTTFCFGDSLFLNACTGHTNYQWFNNGIAIPGAINATDTVTQSGNYSFTAMSAGGCNVVSDTVSITVNQAPNATIAASGGTCAATNFFAAVQTCAGCSYQWFIDGLPAGNASQVSGVAGAGFFTTGNHTIISIVSNPAGCSDSDTLIKTFHALPAVGIMIGGNPSQLCSNNIYTMTAATNAASPSWSWNFNTLSTALSNTNMLVASAAGSYTVHVIDNITGCSNTAVKIILQSPALNLFPAGCDTLCDTSHVFLPIASFNGNLAGYTIQWFDNAPPYLAPVGNGPSFSLNSFPVGNHNLSVIVTAPNGCMDTSGVYGLVTANCLSLVAVKELSLQVKQQHSFAQLRWRVNNEINNDYFIAERSFDGSTFVFAGKIASRGDSNIPQEYTFSDLITMPDRPVYYRVISVDQNGNRMYSAIVKLEPVSPAEDYMIAVPNITAASTRVYVRSNGPAAANLAVYAADGRLIKTFSLHLLKGVNMFGVDLQSFPAGIYLAAMQVNGQRKTVRIVKQ